MPPPSVMLNCRLLCACGCAYYIDSRTGRYEAPKSGDRFSPVVGYETTPTPFDGGPHKIDAVPGRREPRRHHRRLPRHPAALAPLDRQHARLAGRFHLRARERSGSAGQGAHRLLRCGAGPDRAGDRPREAAESSQYEASVRYRPQQGRRDGLDRRLSHAREPDPDRAGG